MTDQHLLGPDRDVDQARLSPPSGSLLLAADQDPMLSANLLTKSQLRRLASTPPQAVVEDMFMEGTVNLLIGDSGLGKAQPLDAPVLTPQGWTTMGALRVGQAITGSDGRSHTVLALYPQGDKRVWEVELSDGTVIPCCEDHLWTISGQRARNLVLTTAALRARVNRRTPAYIEPLTPVEFAPRAPLPADPYLIGYLIGNGTLGETTPLVDTQDPEVLARLAASLPEGLTLVPKAGTTYRIAGTKGGRNPLATILTDLDLKGRLAVAKHIPETYLRASIADRIELLRGLYDSDGTVGKDGSTSFTTISPLLAAQVRELVGSLGGVTTQHARRTQYTYNGERRTGQESYTIQTRMTICPFWVARKAARWHTPRYMRRRVVRVGPTRDYAPMQCLRTSAEDHLYVTSGWALTHNTPWLEQLAICVATGSPFLGLQTQQGKVLFCDAESAGSHFVGYIGALEQFLGVQSAEDAISYYMANFLVHQEAPVSEFEVRLAEKADIVQPKLIIIDCLRPFWPDAETKSDIAARVIRNLRAIATKHAAAIVVVHHRRKDARPQKGVEAPNLETNHREWLNEAAGTRTLINQTDCRLGIDIAREAGSTYPEETYCVAGFSKHEGDILPTYFSRIYDDQGRPRGYDPAVPGITTEQARIFNLLPHTYSFGDVFQAKGTKSKRASSQLVKLFVMAGIAKGKGLGKNRHYVKEVDHVDATLP